MKFLIFMIIFIQILNADLLQEQQKSFKKAYKNLTKSIGQLYIDDKNLNLNPKCDINWQQTFCKGDMMCYSTKCFYAIESKDLYAVILSEHIIYLEQTDINSLKEVMPRIKSMIDFGLPLDNMKHDFSFRDSNNFLCKYWVWQKDNRTLEVNLTGCQQNKEIIHTIFEDRELTDTRAQYTRVLKEHIKFLESQANKNTKLISKLKELVNFGMPNDNKKHDFSFRDSNNFLCKYWVWRKNKKITEVNLTGCNKGVNILYTFNNELSGKGIIEVYTILDSKVD